MMKHLLLWVSFVLLPMSLNARVVQPNGDITSDPVFSQLPKAAESINACLSTRPVEVCKSSYLAKEDKVISGIQVVHDVFPKLPPYTKTFRQISWEQPLGALSTVKGEDLYVLTGSVNDTYGKVWYLRYRFVMQAGQLKLYGIAFSPTKLKAEIPYTDNKPTNTGSQFKTNSNNDIIQDDTFSLLPNVALKLNDCISTGNTESCRYMLAKDDAVISNIKIVHDLLPKLPSYTQNFGPISFDAPKGALSTVDGENLYVLTGKTMLKSTGQQFYLRYRMVKQNGVLKIYGIVFSPSPVESMIPR